MSGRGKMRSLQFLLQRLFFFNLDFSTLGCDFTEGSLMLQHWDPYSALWQLLCGTHGQLGPLPSGRDFISLSIFHSSSVPVLARFPALIFILEPFPLGFLWPIKTASNLGTFPSRETKKDRHGLFCCCRAALTVSGATNLSQKMIYLLKPWS